MEIQITRLHTAILVAILFVSIGWIAPAAYGSYAPENHFIENHEFSAEDTTTSANSHFICFNRTVHDPHSGTVFTELWLVNGNEERVTEVDSRTVERYFQSGHRKIKTAWELPDKLKTGEYRYVLVVEMDLVNGRVEREFVFVSESFIVTENETKTGNTSC